jgi:DNA-binding MarR family transcriptional regulator
MSVRGPHFEVETSMPEDSARCEGEASFPRRSTNMLEMFELLSNIQRLARSLRGAWDKQLRKSIPNMSAARAAVILQLGRSGGASQTRLALLLGLSQMTVSRLLGRLEHLGLVQREPVPGDRRTWAVRLSQSGREALFAVHAARSAFLQRSSCAIGDEHMATLVATLARLEQVQAEALDV